jgi:hypothetical protein
MTPGHEPRREFFKASPGPDGRGLKSNFLCISYENKILLVFKKGYEFDIRPRGEGVITARGQK